MFLESARSRFRLEGWELPPLVLALTPEVLCTKDGDLGFSTTEEGDSLPARARSFGAVLEREGLVEEGDGRARMEEEEGEESAEATGVVVVAIFLRVEWLPLGPPRLARKVR
jgi:hypothetical protein